MIFSPQLCFWNTKGVSDFEMVLEYILGFKEQLVKMFSPNQFSQRLIGVCVTCCLLSKPKVTMTSLIHYVRQQPPTAVPAKAKADIANESVQSYSFLLDRGPNNPISRRGQPNLSFKLRRSFQLCGRLLFYSVLLWLNKRGKPISET